MSANLIGFANVDKKFGISNKGRRLFTIPNAVQFFKEETRGKFVLMDHDMFLTLGFPLIERKNIVLRNNAEYHRDSRYLTFMPEDRLKKFFEGIDDDVYVIGGKSVFDKFIPDCSRIILVEYDKTFDADTFFPDIKAPSIGFQKLKKLSTGYYRDASYGIFEYMKPF